MFRQLFSKLHALPRGVKVATGGWLAFSATHLTFAEPSIREKLIDFFGSQTNYRYFYSAVATAITGTTLILYTKCTPEQRGRILHNLYRKSSPGVPSSKGYKLAIFLRALGIFFITESFVTAYRNPLCMTEVEPTSPRSIQRMYQICGLQRITRHHEWLGYSLFAMGCLLPYNRVADAILFGTLPIFTLVGIWHQERRLKKIKPSFYFEKTSIVPFAAVIDDRQPGSKIWSELSPASYAAFFVTIGRFVFWP